MKKIVRIISICAAICSLIAVLSSCGYPDFVGNKIKTRHEYLLDFSALNREEKQEIEFNEGDGIAVEISLTEGEVALSVYCGSERLYSDNGLSAEKFTLTVKKSGRYTVSVTGKKARGKVRLEY